MFFWVFYQKAKVQMLFLSSLLELDSSLCQFQLVELDLASQMKVAPSVLPLFRTPQPEANKHKKVLQRDRKRRTTRGVSCPCAVPEGRGGWGYPCPCLGQGAGVPPPLPHSKGPGIRERSAPPRKQTHL